MKKHLVFVICISSLLLLIAASVTVFIARDRSTSADAATPQATSAPPSVYAVNSLGGLYAYNAKTGVRRWRFLTDDTTNTSPLVANGLVYFGSGVHNVYALNTLSGKVVWQRQLPDVPVGKPALVNGALIVVAQDGYLYALNAQKGNIMWKIAIGQSVYEIHNSPVVANGIIYVTTSDRGLLAINATTHKLLWEYHAPNLFSTDPLVSGGKIYVGDYQGNVNAFSLSGAVLWTKLVGSGDQGLNNLASANGKIYVGSHDHDLYCLDATTGNPLWSQTVPNLSLSAPIVANGVVYIGSDNGLAAFKADDGTLLWVSPNQPDFRYGTPAYGSSMIFTAGGGQYMNAFSLSGKLLWSSLLGSFNMTPTFK